MEDHKVLKEIAAELRNQEEVKSQAELEDSINKILYQQLRLLAEYSLAIDDAQTMLETLPAISRAMVDIADRLKAS